MLNLYIYICILAFTLITVIIMLFIIIYSEVARLHKQIGDNMELMRSHDELTSEERDDMAHYYET